MAITERVQRRLPKTGTRTNDCCIQVHLVTYRAHGFWYGEAPSLSLRAKGDTEEGALASLRDSIQLYVDTAKTLGRLDELVPRRAPLSDLLRVQARAIAAVLRLSPGSYITESVQIR